MPSCGEALVALIERMGAGTVFGIPGVHTLELYRGLGDSSLRHVAPRHEQGAAFMADGWARVTGNPGVCILIGGPGLTNAITPIAQAYHDSIPMLVISGAVPDSKHGRGEIHDLPDQQALMSTVTAFSHTLRDPAELPAVLDRAVEVFRSRRPRPVHIGVAHDVLRMQAPIPAWAPPASERPVADPAALDRATALLSGARRPLVLLGGGAQDAGAQALALARRIAAPIGLTINGRGAVPDRDPLCLGSALSFAPVSDLLRDADAVVLAGAQLSDLELWGLSEPLTLRGVIRVDIDADQLSNRWPAEVALHADAGAALSAMAQRVPGRAASDVQDAEAVVRRARQTLQAPAELSRFADLLAVIDRVLGEDRIITGDSTQPVYAANHLLGMDRPRSWLMPIGYGCLGCAMPMAIGAKLAAPDRPVLALAGDGGVMFTIQELAAAREAGVAMVTLVYDNDGYGEIRDSMDHAGIAQLGTDAPTHNLAAIAEGFGVPALRTRTVAELEEALRRAFAAGGPVLVHHRDRR